jgi:flavin prenyltransferase
VSEIIQEKKRFAVGITGASGVGYGRRFLQRLAPLENVQVDLVVSPAARKVLRDEEGLDIGQEPYRLDKLLGQAPSEGRFVQHAFLNLGAPPASGSVPYDGYVVIPCSTGSLGRLAAGVSDSLITRMADVALKERRKLVLVPRETPLSTIHLQNMLRLSEAGAVILPAAPGFYKGGTSTEQLLDFVVNRIFLQLGLPVESKSRWKGSDARIEEREGRVMD